ILKALDKDPARRYQTASQFADDLRRFLDDRPILARRTSWPERLSRWCRRNPVISGLLALSIVLLTVIAVGSTVNSLQLRVQLKRAEDAEQAERTALQKKTEALNSETAARQAADRSLFDAYLSQARGLRTSHRSGQRFDSLAAIRKAIALRETV